MFLPSEYRFEYPYGPKGLFCGLQHLFSRAKRCLSANRFAVEGLLPRRAWGEKRRIPYLYVFRVQVQMHAFTAASEHFAAACLGFMLPVSEEKTHIFSLRACRFKFFAYLCTTIIRKGFPVGLLRWCHSSVGRAKD